MGLVSEGKRANRKQTVGLAIAEAACLSALLAYGIGVVSMHSSLSVLIYSVFGILFLVECYVFWLFFIVERRRFGPKTADARHLVLIVALSAVLAVLLEVGTLKGAPLATPTNLADWRISRLIIFFAVSMPVVGYLTMSDWHARVDRIRGPLLADGRRGLHRLVITLVVLVAADAVTCVVTFLICRAIGNANIHPYMFSFSVMMSMVVVLVSIRHQLGERPERGVVTVILAAGLILAVITPHTTLASWDDDVHYSRAVALSYVVDPEYTPADRALGFNHDFNDMWRCHEQYNTDNGPFNDDRYWDEYRQLDAMALDTTHTIKVEGASTFYGTSMIQYYTIAYIPAAAGLWLGRLLDLPFHIVFALGRLANLAMYAWIIYFAMRRMRSGRMILGVIALIPMSVYLGSGYSYDFWLNAFLLFGFASFIGELQRPDEPLDRRNLVMMLGSFLLAMGPKAIYVPLMLILLLMPKRKFTGEVSRRRYLTWVIVCVLFVTATFMLPYLFVNGAGPGDPRAHPGVDPGAQTTLLLSDPIRYAGVFLSLLIGYISPSNATYLSDFCFLGISGTWGLYLCLLVAVTFTDRRECDHAYAALRYRIWPVVWSLLCIVLYSTVLYLTFTPVGWSTIDGVQPRYLLPLLFPVLALTCNIHVINRVSLTRYNNLVTWLSAVVLFTSVCQVLVCRFW